MRKYLKENSCLVDWEVRRLNIRNIRKYQEVFRTMPEALAEFPKMKAFRKEQQHQQKQELGDAGHVQEDRL